MDNWTWPRTLPTLVQWSSATAALVVLAVLGRSLSSRWLPFRRSGQVLSAALSVQLPPLRFWLGLCHGFSVGDALWVAAHAGLFLYTFWSKLALWPGDLCRYTADVDACRAKAAFGLMGFMSKSVGTVLAAQTAMLMYYVPRSNVLSLLLGSHHATLIRFHRWLGWAVLGTTALHAAMYSWLWILQQRWLATVMEPANLAGLVATVLGGVIGASSSDWCRRCLYHVFRIVHITAAPLFIIAAIIHARKMAFYMAPSLALYAADAGLRWWQWFRNRQVLDASCVRLEGDKLVTLTLGPWRQGTVRPGDTVWLHARLGAVHSLVGHPFSVAGVTELSTVMGAMGGRQRGGGHPLVAATVHVRVDGPWTRALAQQAKACVQSGTPLRLQVEGPYTHAHALGGGPAGAPPPTSMEQPLVLVAGGIGVTPVLAILRSLRPCSSCTSSSPASSPSASSSAASSSGCLEGAAPATAAPAPHVHLLFAARTEAEFALLDPDLLDPLASPWLSVTLACTGPKALADVEGPLSVLRTGAPKQQPHPPTLPASTLLAVTAPLGTVLATFSLVGSCAAMTVVSFIDMCGKMGTCSFRPGPVKMGLFILLLMAAGSAVGMATALLLHACVRWVAAVWVRGRRASRATRAHGSSAGLAGDAEDVEQEGLLAASSRALQLRLQEDAVCSVDVTTLSHRESRRQVQHGRPDVASFLQNVRAQHSHVATVPVLVGGPLSLWAQVCASCQLPSASEGARLRFKPTKLTYSY